MYLDRVRGNPFWTSLIFGRIQTAFWVLFIVVPIFTGVLAYHWLPNEAFDKERHELLDSHDASDGERYGEVADTWRDRKSGEIFSRNDFTTHRMLESRRMALVWFVYGLLGCFAFGFTRWARGRRFFRAFGIASLINLAVSAYEWYSIASTPP